MRIPSLFIAALGLLVLLSSAAASPGSTDKSIRNAAIDEQGQVILGSAMMTASKALAPGADADSTDVAIQNAPKYNWRKYHINCDTYSHVCDNWCYYVFCRKGDRHGSDSSPFWNVTVSHDAPAHAQSECTRLHPNKCSVDSRAPWPANPTPDQECTAAPAGTTSEGGPNAATRCVPRAESVGEAKAWETFINTSSDTSGRIEDGTIVKVVLDIFNETPGCLAIWYPGAAWCDPPATPTDPGVARDAIRRQ
ncbi:hypothetical protein PsYK624_160980 [Phanerochaete sordida]|uniref:Uncharacterized protein n=1 Tax=Phanerochaete sordida TaxID=48140 RepID=A0A9P3GS56_9APHY|nr:hypothetical protein PsYK624_160980 [Phanerochaete sordida]